MPPIPSQPTTRKRSVLKCSYCRIDKKKCEVAPGNETCKRCVAKGFECSALTARPSGRTRRSMPGPAPSNSARDIQLETDHPVEAPSSASMRPCPCTETWWAPTGMPDITMEHGSGSSADSGRGVEPETSSDSETESDRVAKMTMLQALWGELPISRTESGATPFQRNLWPSSVRLARTFWVDEPSQDGDFLGEHRRMLADTLDKANKLHQDGELEKAESACRRVMHGALLHSGSPFYAIYIDALLRLVTVLTADGRFEEAIALCQSVLFGDQASKWKERVEKKKLDNVQKAWEEVVDDSRMGFLGTGLELRFFITSFVPTEWTEERQDMFLACIRRYPPTKLVQSFKILLYKSLDLDQTDAVGMWYSLFASRDDLQPLLGQMTSHFTTDTTGGNIPAWSRFIKDVKVTYVAELRKRLVELIENATPWDRILEKFRDGDSDQLANVLKEEEDLTEILVAVLEFEREDILHELFSRGLEKEVFGRELLLRPDDSTSRPWMQNLLQHWGLQRTKSGSTKIKFRLSGGRSGGFVFTSGLTFTILELACLTGRSSLVSELFQDLRTFPRYYRLRINAMYPLNRLDNLLRLGILGGDLTVLENLLHVFQGLRLTSQTAVESTTSGNLSQSGPPDLELTLQPSERGSDVVGNATGSQHSVTASRWSYTWSCVGGSCESADAFHNVCKPGNRSLPIHLAVYVGKLEATRLLLQHGVNPAFFDFKNRTPLFHAIVFGREARLMELLADSSYYTGRFGTSSAENSEGWTLSETLVSGLSDEDKSKLALRVEELQQSNCLPSSLAACLDTLRLLTFSHILPIASSLSNASNPTRTESVDFLLDPLPSGSQVLPQPSSSFPPIASPGFPSDQSTYDFLNFRHVRDGTAFEQLSNFFGSGVV
ncbi:hypothetical protein BJ508DRAFT_313185 [Ascobolus immersus RN42]|uniref:Uncharacterized protein n=1 Tax=Ascobolus immersus RN42 TaxID=1160509 RepID=A0A3N4HQM8_ASCIM|nr:hypothetical protein BJ508DRAFT_313185 [Ascobolus immersus RN42]